MVSGFLGPQWANEQGSKTFLGSAGIAERLLFSMLPSSLTLEFDLIFAKCWLFGAPLVYFWGLDKVQKQFLGLII